MKNPLIGSSYLNTYDVHESCPNCGTESSTLMTIKFTFFRLLFIILPRNKRIVVTRCTSCNFEMNEQTMPENFKNVFNQVKRKGYTPAWVYSGFLVLIFIGTMVAVTLLRLSETREYLNNPRRGDCYQWQTQDDYHTLYRVNKVEGENLFVSRCKYGSSTSEGVSDLFDKPFSEQYEIFTKTQVREKYNKGLIRAVHRQGEYVFNQEQGDD